MDRYKGKVIVVTGAGGGIGRASAIRFASEGGSVVAVDFQEEALSKTLQIVKDAGGDIHGVQSDVGDAEQVQQYLEESVSVFGGVDVLFNNAGIVGGIGPLEALDEATFDELFRINVKSVWLGMRFAKPFIAERGGGAIINTASAAGLTATPTLMGYGASKHAVVGMTKTAAVEMGPMGIRVNCICPGIVSTQMIQTIENKSVSLGLVSSADQYQQAYSDRTPLKRYVEASEVAALAAFLGSDESGMITGETSVIDGGFLQS